MWVEQLKSGRHRGTFRTPAGRKVSKTFDYAYEAEAWAVAAERGAIEAATGGTPTPAARPTGPTIARHGQAWLARKSRLSTATVKWYGACLRGIAATELGDIPIDQPRRSTIETWLGDQVREGVGRPTINGRLKVLRMIFKDGLAEGLCDRDPTDGLDYLPTSIRPDRVLSRLEEGQLLAQATPHLSAMILLALDAGLRWEEAAAVDTGCFLGEFLVVHQVIERDTRRIRGFTKSWKPRNVPMTARLMDALAPLRAESDGLLFTTKVGTPLDYFGWRRDQWRPTCYRARLKPRPRFHDLRHTYGSRLAAEGVPRVEIAALMGHADEETTARYIHKGVDGHRLKLVRDALA